MPLAPSSSQAVIGKNIATERAAGKPEKQAIAIAESEARRSGDAGGPVGMTLAQIQEANLRMHDLRETHAEEQLEQRVGPIST